MIKDASVPGYLACKSRTTGIAGSSASLTLNMISKEEGGYICLKVDSRFS
jgi:hypothetical protein